MQQTIADEIIMSLVERVLTRPQAEREDFLRNECGADSQLYGRALKYVQWEQRMGGFLLDPFYAADAEECPFQAGQLLLERFRIVREVARGGMGIVWEATDETLERRVAIKCARAGFGKQLPPELQNAREISHPNVCKLFELHTVTGPKGDIDFISMEYLDGETLAERMRRGRLAPTECRNIAAQLCAGLGEAHRRKVVHGDLKSNNVIMAAGPADSPRAVIMDFGLARRQERATPNASEDVVAGTPAYMAPELWEGVKPSVMSDVYALGVIFWEMISGLRPKDLESSSETIEANGRAASRPPSGYGEWDRVLACCLQANPANRFQSAEEVAGALAVA